MAWWQNEAGEPMYSPEQIRAEERADAEYSYEDWLDDNQDLALYDDEPEEEDDDEPTYTITRFYQDRELERETIATGLTLEEAQEHCHDPETSSTTATSAEAIARTERCGPWFDGYEEE